MERVARAVAAGDYTYYGYTYYGYTYYAPSRPGTGMAKRREAARADEAAAAAGTIDLPLEGLDELEPAEAEERPCPCAVPVALAMVRVKVRVRGRVRGRSRGRGRNG